MKFEKPKLCLFNKRTGNSKPIFSGLFDSIEEMEQVAKRLQAEKKSSVFVRITLGICEDPAIISSLSKDYPSEAGIVAVAILLNKDLFSGFHDPFDGLFGPKQDPDIDVYLFICLPENYHIFLQEIKINDKEVLLKAFNKVGG